MEPVELDLQEAAVVAGRPAGFVTNTLWMFLSQGVTTVIQGGISVWAIRTIDPSHWGQYSAAFALAAVFNVLAGLGIGQLAMRDMAREPAQRQEVFSRALTAQLVTGTVALAAMAGAAYLLHAPRLELYVLALIAPTLLLEPLLSLAYGAFNAAQELVLATMYQLARVVVYGALAVVVLLVHPGIVEIGAALLTGTATATAVAVRLLRTRLGVRLRLASTGIRPFVVAAIPIAGVSIVGIVYDRVDVLMVSALSSSRTVAHYSVPYGWVRLSWIVPSIISGVFFPLLAHDLEHNPDQARTQFFLIVRVFLFLSLPLSLLLAVGAPTLMTGVFGADYRPSVSVLAILAWTSVLGFENYILWWGILAVHKERTVFWIQIGGLALNVAMNAVLIPRIHADGAAVSLICSDLLVVAGQAVVVHRRLFRLPLANLMLKPLVAAAVAVPAGVALARVQPLLGGAVGALVYAALLLISGYISRQEWRPLFVRRRAQVS
jgi:O-antigen/teichoic acid export membrane protein